MRVFNFTILCKLYFAERYYSRTGGKVSFQPCSRFDEGCRVAVSVVLRSVLDACYSPNPMAQQEFDS